MYLRFGTLAIWCLGLAVASETSEQLRGSLSDAIDVDAGADDRGGRELGGYQDTRSTGRKYLGFAKELQFNFPKIPKNGGNNGTKPAKKPKSGSGSDDSDSDDSDDDEVEYGAPLIDDDLLARLERKITLDQLQYLILDVVHDAEENDEDPPEVRTAGRVLLA